MGLPVTAGDGSATLKTHDDGVEKVVHHSIDVHSAGGWTPYKRVSTNTNNAVSIKSSPGQLGVWSCTNTGTAAVYVKFYNKASSPSPGSDTPVLTVMVPPDDGGNNLVTFPGFAFSVGIAMAIVANPADNDNTAVPADEVVVNVGYK